MSITRLEELKSLIVKLQADRQAHLAAIAEIDEAFGTLGIQAPVKKRGRQPGVLLAGVKKRRRRKFKTTGAESIMAFVKAAGKSGVTGAQIDKHWKSEGRSAGCYNTLWKLVHEKKIRRHKLKGEKGSVYTAV